MDYLNKVEMVGRTGRKCEEDAISGDVTRVVFNVYTEEADRGFSKLQGPSTTKIPVSVTVFPGGTFQDFVFRPGTPIRIVGKLVQCATGRLRGVPSDYYVMLSAAEYILNEEEGSL